MAGTIARCHGSSRVNFLPFNIENASALVVVLFVFYRLALRAGAFIGPIVRAAVESHIRVSETTAEKIVSLDEKADVLGEKADAIMRDIREVRDEVLKDKCHSSQ